MDIRNAGNRIMNTWLYGTGDSWVMIDTGYETSYLSVIKKLRKLRIQPEHIRHLFLTHAHDDHAGFLEEWMTRHPQTQVIAHENAISGLGRGQNKFTGGCSSRMAYLFCQLMALLGKGEHRYPKLSQEHLDQILTLNENNLTHLERVLQGKILFTPGHTDDSVSLLVNGNLFCGDAAMNGIPSVHKITIWVEDQCEFSQSWEKMLSSGAEKIYPAHGKPFLPEELMRNKKRIADISLRPLKQKEQEEILT